MVLKILPWVWAMRSSPFELFRGLDFIEASEAADHQPYGDPHSNHRQPSNVRQEYSQPPEASPYVDLQHFRQQQRLRITSNSQVFTSPARRTFSTHFLPPFTIQIRGAMIGSDAGTNVRVIATVVDQSDCLDGISALDCARSINFKDNKVGQTKVLDSLSTPGLPRDHIFQTCTSGLGRLVGNQFFEDETTLGRMLGESQTSASSNVVIWDGRDGKMLIIGAKSSSILLLTIMTAVPPSSQGRCGAGHQDENLSRCVGQQAIQLEQTFSKDFFENWNASVEGLSILSPPTALLRHEGPCPTVQIDYDHAPHRWFGLGIKPGDGEAEAIDPQDSDEEPVVQHGTHT